VQDIDSYDKGYYEEREYGFSAESRSDHNLILKLLKIKTQDRILDIGCGFGVLLEKIPSRKKAGIETNDFAIKECRKRGLSVIKADVEKGLPYKDSSFEVVIMNNVIEHLQKPGFTLRECFRVLVPKGKIVITTPILSSLAVGLDPTHCSEMSIKEMKSLLEKHGFKILGQYASGVAFLYPFLNNLLFKPCKFLRKMLGKEKRCRKGVVLIDSARVLADKSFLKPLSMYRKHFLGLGLSQLILAQKEGK